MIHIQVRNVYSQLILPTESELGAFDSIELGRLLTSPYPSYWFSKAFKNGSWDGHQHFLKKDLKFPTGLLFIVTEYLSLNKIDYVVENPFLRVLSRSNRRTRLAKVTLYPYQQKAIDQALIRCRGIIEVGTGGGKTEIAAGIIKELNIPTLFIVNTKELLHQTYERFKLRLERDIGRLGDGITEIEPSIIVATIQSLYSMFKKDQATAKAFLNLFQMVILDECHHSSSMEWYKILMFMHNAGYRFGLSGTPCRRDVLSNMKAMAVTGNIIYSKLSAGLIEDKYLSGIDIEMVENDELVMGKNWQQIYNDGIVMSEPRNTLIVDIAEREFRDGKKVLVLVRQIKHGHTLQSMLESSRQVPAVFIWGAHESWERGQVKHKFNEEGKMVLISSGILDEGVDIPEIDVLIIGSGGCSEVKAIQRVGRGLRKKKSGGKLKVYDFIDAAQYLEAHSKQRIKIYKKEGFIK